MKNNTYIKWQVEYFDSYKNNYIENEIIIELCCPCVHGGCEFLSDYKEYKENTYHSCYYNDNKIEWELNEAWRLMSIISFISFAFFVFLLYFLCM